MFKRERTNIILAVLTGILTALCFEPFSMSFLAFFAYIPLLFVFDNVERSWKKILVYSWTAMFVTVIICFQWIGFVASEFGFLPGWIAVIVLIAFSLLTNYSLQIFSMIYYLVLRHTGWKKGRLFYFLLIPSAFVISEFLDPRIFNWYIGNALTTYKYLPQLADIFGAYGLSFLIVLVNVCLFLVLKHIIRNRRLEHRRLIPEFSIIAAVPLLLLVYGYFNYRHIQDIEEKCPKIHAAVVQANIGNPMQFEVNQAAKLRKELGGTDGRTDQDLILKKYILMTGKAVKENPDVNLVVWPETAFPGYYVDRNPNMHEHRKAANELGVPFIIGGYYIEDHSRNYYNSAIMVTDDGVRFYHKKILLPFGEFMPLGSLFPFLKNVVPAVGDFSRGSGPATLDLLVNGLEVKFAPTICYEVLKSGYVRDMYKKDAQVFLNLSNDSWFGVVEPYQHLRLARMRAVEYRRPIIRSTNTGITSFIDMNGMVVEKGGMNREETLIFDVPVCDHRLRTVYSIFGHLLPYVLMAVCAAVVFYARRRER